MLQSSCHVIMLIPLQYNTKHHIEPVTNGNYLMVSGVEPGDEGNYTCAVSTVKKEELSHYLRVRSKYDHTDIYRDFIQSLISSIYLGR